MQKIVIIVIISVLVLLNVLQFSWDYIAYRYPIAVPDEETARAIGAALFGGGGRDPDSLTVTYIPNKKAWWICGLPLPEDSVGATYSVLIRKRDGKVVYFDRGA